MRWLVVIFCVSSVLAVNAHEQKDTTRLLTEVIVKAYASDRPANEVSASLGLVKEYELNRFSNTSLLPAVNTIPGVRMEERSPGSYRFAIRGSSLRSPFGVRNVKFYWNGLPLTDGGGNTYLNLLDFNSVGSMEIIKGPGASLYGAGTGGVVLLNSPASGDLQTSVVAGSYGLLRVEGGGTIAQTEKFQMNMRLGYQQADGYRQQTKMNRFTALIDWKAELSKRSILSGTLFSTQLYYQTPGGLTKAQYDADPRQARPAAGTTPGAVEQQAAVDNKTSYGGLSYERAWNDSWVSHIGAFGSITDFKNPTIRNYETREEKNWGGRFDTQFKFKESRVDGKVTFGAEYQRFSSPVTDYDNNQGTPGNVQTSDRLSSQLLLAFAQAELDLPSEFYLTVGASGNFINYRFLRTSVTPEVSQVRNFDPVLSPRVALLKKLSTAISVYGSISSGFSPPSLAEVRPSTATFNNTLSPELGTNYEAGVKGQLSNHLETALTFYDFRLKNTIVIQRDVTGADYFVNAGATSQQGAELFLRWSSGFAKGKLTSFRAWTSYTYNHYRFRDYVNDGKDYSGNSLTGVPANILVTGVDLFFRMGFYMNITGSYTDRLPLNDANTDYASDYFLVGARVGYTVGKKVPLEFFAGADNLLDQRYSLGNDLNAAGARYYNAAAGRNYWVGLVVRLGKG